MKVSAFKPVELESGQGMPQIQDGEPLTQNRTLTGHIITLPPQHPQPSATPNLPTTQSPRNSESPLRGQKPVAVNQGASTSEARCLHATCRGVVFRGPNCENSLLRHDRAEHQGHKFKCPIAGCSKTPSGRRHNIIDHLGKKHNIEKEKAVRIVPRSGTRAPNRQR